MTSLGAGFCSKMLRSVFGSAFSFELGTMSITGSEN